VLLGLVHRSGSIGCRSGADGCHRSVNSLPIEAISSPLAP
jgi:hypothetical protein